MYNWSPNV